MPGNTDLSALTREQLIHLVQVRGQALEFSWEAEGRFIEKLAGHECNEGYIEAYKEEKTSLWMQFMRTEEEIIGGSGQTAN